MAATLKQPIVDMGCDPELFIRDTATGRIVASEEALARVPSPSIYSKGVLVVPDGVQAEIHPGHGSCMSGVSQQLAHAIMHWGSELLKKGLRLDFTQTIELSEEEFEKLPAKSRVLGCMPSFNIYEPDSQLGVDGSTYRKRSCGGHVHMGFLNPTTPENHPWKTRRADFVPLLDVLCGNTFVLIDRDPLAAERRKVYGRAGEYRLPDHGLEYRTPSNFWLKSFPLANFVLQMCRSAWQVGAASLPGIKRDYSVSPSRAMLGDPPVHNFAGELMSLVDLEKVRKAINENSFDLAWENFQAIKPFIAKYWVETRENSPFPYGSWPLSRTKFEDFEFFVTEIRDKGIERWFGDDPHRYWVENYVQRTVTGTSGFNDPSHGTGWNSFLLETVRPARLEASLKLRAEKFAELVQKGAMLPPNGGPHEVHLSA
jgi:hypothetical protein